MVSRQRLIVGVVVVAFVVFLSGAYAVRKQVGATLNPEGTS